MRHSPSGDWSKAKAEFHELIAAHSLNKNCLLVSKERNYNSEALVKLTGLAEDELMNPPTEAGNKMFGQNATSA